MKKILITLLLVCGLMACGNSSSTGVYTNLSQIAIDSNNDRLFLIQTPGQMFVHTASTLADLGDGEPLVSEDNNASIHNLLPYVVTQFTVYSSGSSSRLFVMGAETTSAGTVLNRIRVIDFDGSGFSEASFSPIALDDADDTTDESDNAFADMIIDQENGLLYVTDATDGHLYVVDVTDGTQPGGPYDIAGVPQGMSLDNGYLYVCNSSDTEAEQLITVYDVSDYSTTTIDVEGPCSEIDVISNDAATVMLVKRYDEQEILIRTIDTTTYDNSEAVVAADSGYHDGYLISDKGITSSVSKMFLVKNADDEVYGFLSELDGNVEQITFNAGLTSYLVEAKSTSATNLGMGVSLLNSQNNATQSYIIAASGALLDIDLDTLDIEVLD